MSRQYLHGRIFDRALKFATLSPEVQEETKACEHYLMEHKEEIFRMHHASPFRTVYSVRGKQLVEVIETWLKEGPVVVNVVPLEVNPVQDGSPTNPDPVQEDGLPTNPEIEDPVHEDRPTNPEHAGSEQEDGLPTDPENEDPVQEDRPPSDPAQEASVDPDVSNEDHPVVGSNVHADPSTTSPPIMEAIPSTHPPQPSTVVEELKNRRFHAKELMVAMLCHGFLALHKEWHKEYMYKDLDLYIPVVKELKKDDCILVWEAVENALFAAPIQRKMGLLSRIAHGKENFIVIKEQMIFIYENDTIPSHPLIEWNTSSIKLNVTYDSNQFPHGIKLWNEDITEVLNTRDSMEQDWLMYALVSTGMEYLEPIPSISSLYTIKEKTLEGQEMDLNQFKGCVLLIVNIASEEDPSSAVQNKELMDLHEKYKNDGLIIIGMPCTQFGGTKLNFVEYFQNIGLTFRLLEQGMVNGLMTRPLFSFLKSILRGPNGLFVDWNFTKFVVDRHGVPVRRFEHEETPLMLEDVIVELLSQVPPLEVMEEKVAALEAATQVVESVGEAMLAKEGPEEDVQMVDKAFEMWKEDETSHNTKQMNQEMGPQAVFS